VFFCFSLDYVVLVLFAFVVLGLVTSVLHQETGWEERLRNGLFPVEFDVEPFNRSINVKHELQQLAHVINMLDSQKTKIQNN